MTEGRDEALVKKIRQQLDRSVESLDAETRSRLSTARNMALETATARSRPFWLPAGAMALASMLMIAVIVTRVQAPMPEDSDLLLALMEDGQDLELVSAIDNLELLEDLDFYYWLEEGVENAG